MAKSRSSAIYDSDESQGPPWKSYLYQLQLQAPKPKRIVCQNEVQDKPSYYGREFHGKIAREEADSLLSGNDGCYLVRQSQRAVGAYTLSLRFNGVTKNYKLYYDGKHYVGEKRFDTVQDLVADGLITMYLESKAADYIALMCKQSNYEKSPYMTLSCRKRRQITKRELKENSKNNRKTHVIDSVDSIDSNKVESNKNDELDDSIDSLLEEVDVLQYEKPHVFKVHNFKGLQWCDLCGNFMWGLIAQGVKCEDCGFSAHKKCSEQVPADCLPQLRYVKRMFGVDLTTLVKVHNTPIPVVVEMCVNEIEKRGLDNEGIYRISGFNDSVEMAKMLIDTYGAEADISKQAFEDVNVICSVLKLYFRLLPIPLITFDTYPHFLTSAKKQDEEKLNGICEAVNMLPPAHYQTLKYLMQHLSRIAENHAKNLMTSANLSMVFCPTLMRTPDIIYSPESLVAWKYESWVIEALISQHKRLFDH